MANWTEPTEERQREWDEWVAARPESLRELGRRFKPWKVYRLTARDGTPQQRVRIISFVEPDGVVGHGCGHGGHGCGCVSEKFAEPTLTVFVDKRFNLVAHERRVGPILASQLEECDLPKLGELVGSAELTPAEIALPASLRNELLMRRYEEIARAFGERN